jgi:hypothetical protein
MPSSKGDQKAEKDMKAVKDMKTVKDVKDVKTASATMATATVAGKVKSPRWGDEEENEQKENVADEAEVEAEEEEEEEEEEEVEGGNEGGEGAVDNKKAGLTHEYVYVLTSEATAEVVNNYLLKLMAIPTFVGAHIDAETGEEITGKYEAILMPRTVQDIRRQIANANKKKTSGGGGGGGSVRLLVTNIEPLVLVDSELGDWRTHFTDSLFLRLPQRMAAAPLRKHIEKFFELCRGKGLAEPKQYEIDIPMNRDGSHHRRQCVIQFSTREAAERRKNKNPDAQVKMSNRCRESSVAFIRHLLNSHRWPTSIPLLDNDPVINADAGLAEEDDDQNPQIEPQYNISCEFNKRHINSAYRYRKQHK